MQKKSNLERTIKIELKLKDLQRVLSWYSYRANAKTVSQNDFILAEQLIGIARAEGL